MQSILLQWRLPVLLLLQQHLLHHLYQLAQTSHHSCKRRLHPNHHCQLNQPYYPRKKCLCKQGKRLDQQPQRMIWQRRLQRHQHRHLDRINRPVYYPLFILHPQQLHWIQPWIPNKTRQGNFVENKDNKKKLSRTLRWLQIFRLFAQMLIRQSCTATWSKLAKGKLECGTSGVTRLMDMCFI